MNRNQRPEHIATDRKMVNQAGLATSIRLILNVQQSNHLIRAVTRTSYFTLKLQAI
ncbi:protein of unknown function [Paraburkholderia dioscoreae]|uniref:Uncharacterized protein n=1 Tax=Paraburkholderia dioscoreae TaxID=2604047 RepID=A0A5Q4ZRS5_9BURK|nr:protein of unknown function [Paraburkholderia dioscoreae]